jgi:hypothetical protein
MIRINIDALETKDNLYFLNGEAFQGVGYEVSAHQVVAAYQFEQGQRIEKLDSVILPGRDALGVHSDFLEPHEENYDGEPFSFNGQPYTGLAYEFRNHRCVSEELYVGGSLQRAITWYPSGNMDAYEILDEDVTQDIAWFENGQPKFVKYAEKDVFLMDFRFSENGLATCAWIEGDYFGRLGALREKLKLSYLDLDYIQHELSVDESVFMAGDGINDEILHSLFDSGGLSGAKAVHLFHTAISGDGIDLLSHLENLEHLIVESDEDRAVKEALIRLKKAQPILKIEWNRTILPSYS